MSRPSAISRQASHVPARLGRRALLAVQHPRQDARRRRLAHAARPGEDERLGDAARPERVAEGLRHVALPDDLVERSAGASGGR